MSSCHIPGSVECQYSAVRTATISAAVKETHKKHRRENELPVELQIQSDTVFRK